MDKSINPENDTNASNDWPLYLEHDVRTFPANWDLSELGKPGGSPAQPATPTLGLDMDAIAEELDESK